MKIRRRQGLFFALLISLALHLVLLIEPGWSLGGLGDAAPPEPLEANLVAPPLPKPPPPPKPRPQPAETPQPVVQPAAPAPADIAPTSAAATAPTGPAAPPPSPPATVPATPPAVAEAAPDAPIPLPHRGRIGFNVYKGDKGERSLLVGRTVHEWSHDGKNYRLSAVTETVGLAALFRSVKIQQLSEGGFLKGELKPTRFRNDRGQGDVVESVFDWQARTASLADGRSVPVGDGAEDMLSMFYQLMQAAQRGEGFVMAVATGRKLERYGFEWLGEEQLDIKAGRFHAWHVRIRSADGGGSDLTEVWLGKEVAGLPVRIRYTDRKGEVGDQIAETIEYEK